MLRLRWPNGPRGIWPLLLPSQVESLPPTQMPSPPVPPKIALDDDELDRIFEDFVDPDRIARMEGPRVADNFMVKLRGQDANVDKKGDRYDVARAQPQGKHIEEWTAA